MQVILLSNIQRKIIGGNQAPSFSELVQISIVKYTVRQNVPFEISNISQNHNIHISFFFFFTDINISYSTLLILFKISLFYIFLSYYSHSFSNFSFLYLLYNKIIQTSCNFFYLYSINKKSCDNKCVIISKGYIKKDIASLF